MWLHSHEFEWHLQMFSQQNRLPTWRLACAHGCKIMMLASDSMRDVRLGPVQTANCLHCQEWSSCKDREALSK